MVLFTETLKSHWQCHIHQFVCKAELLAFFQVGYNSMGHQGAMVLITGIEANECSSLTLLDLGVSFHL